MDNNIPVPISRPEICVNRSFEESRKPVSILPRIVSECDFDNGETVGLLNARNEVDETSVLKILDEMDETPFSEQKIRDVYLAHSVSPWVATRPHAESGLVIHHQEGFFCYDCNGKEYLDINSLQMNANLGFDPPVTVLKAIEDALRYHFHSTPTAQLTPLKAKLCTLLDAIFPGDLSHFYFCNSGAEANEAAIRMSRRFTGKSKILSFYRSYHGATQLALSVAGDPRRHFVESEHSIVHLASLEGYSLDWGSTDKERTKRMLDYVEECIIAESPSTIAAMILEPVVGTNGILIPPPGFLQGIRALCDKYAILMICDEVMSGWLRTGRWFAFMHSSGYDDDEKDDDEKDDDEKRTTKSMIIPDIVTCAKGINCGWIPFGCVATRRKIGNFFLNVATGIGSTYNSHGVGMASCLAVIEYYLRNNVRQHVREIGSHLKQRLDEIQNKHISVKEFRMIGLFCFLELRKNVARNESWCLHLDPPAPVLLQIKQAMLEKGIVTIFKASGFFINPFLNIPIELVDRFCDVIDVVLEISDAVMEKECGMLW